MQFSSFETLCYSYIVSVLVLLPLRPRNKPKSADRRMLSTTDVYSVLRSTGSGVQMAAGTEHDEEITPGDKTVNNGHLKESLVDKDNKLKESFESTENKDEDKDVSRREKIWRTMALYAVFFAGVSRSAQ